MFFPLRIYYWLKASHTYMSAKTKPKQQAIDLYRNTNKPNEFTQDFVSRIS